MPFYTSEQRKSLKALGFIEDSNQDQRALLKPFQKYVYIIRPVSEYPATQFDDCRTHLYQIRSGKMVYASGEDPVKLAKDWVMRFGKRLRDPVCTSKG